MSGLSKEKIDEVRQFLGKLCQENGFEGAVLSAVQSDGTVDVFMAESNEAEYARSLHLAEHMAVGLNCPIEDIYEGDPEDN